MLRPGPAAAVVCGYNVAAALVFSATTTVSQRAETIEWTAFSGLTGTLLRREVNHHAPEEA